MSEQSPIEAGASALVDSCIAKGHWQHATDEAKAVYRKHAAAVIRAYLDTERAARASEAEAVLTGQNYGWIDQEYFDDLEGEYKARFAARAAQQKGTP